MPRTWRMADHMKGYISGANTEPELKMMIAPRMSSRMMSGSSHHFFSWRRNSKNSLASCHILWVPRLLGGSGFLDAIEVGAGAEVEGVADGSGGSHEAVRQGVLADLCELTPGFNDRGFAFFAANVDIAIGVNGRR